MHISVVLCTYNRCETLSTALKSLEEQVVPQEVNWEVLVVDNNSKDGTREVTDSFAKRSPGRFKYLFEGRQGKCYALNTAIGVAEGEILAFTDDDVTFDKEWLWHLKRAFDQYGCSGAGGKIVPVFLAKVPAWLDADEPYPFLNALVGLDYGPDSFVWTRKRTFYGANMAFRKEVFVRQGLFRLDLGPTEGNLLGKGEDSEFCDRAFAGGETLMYVSDAIVYHPAEKQRMTKEYFRKWYFNHGRFVARTVNDVPEDTVRYWGVPRYKLRELVGHFGRSVFSFGTKPRMKVNLRYHQTLGEIWEYYKAQKNTSKSAPSGKTL